MLVSTIQHHTSVITIYMCMFPPSWASIPSHHTSCSFRSSPSARRGCEMYIYSERDISQCSTRLSCRKKWIQKLQLLKKIYSHSYKIQFVSGSPPLSWSHPHGENMSSKYHSRERERQRRHTGSINFTNHCDFLQFHCPVHSCDSHTYCKGEWEVWRNTWIFGEW